LYPTIDPFGRRLQRPALSLETCWKVQPGRQQKGIRGEVAAHWEIAQETATEQVAVSGVWG
jgi:hypothetical protein